MLRFALDVRDGGRARNASGRSSADVRVLVVRRVRRDPAVLRPQVSIDEG
jgi:hypothetical protein